MTTVDPTPRRRAGGSRHPGRGSAVAAFLVVGLAAVAVLFAGSATPASRSASTGSAELVTRLAAACPGLTQSTGTSTRLLAGSAPVRGVGSDGTLRHGTLGGSTSRLPLRRGDLVRFTGSATGPSLLEAQGEIAAGLFGYRADSDDRAGTLALAACAPPRATWWFTGAGATLDHTSRLEITNLDPGPAVVDVRVFGPGGEVQTTGTTGITIAPGTRSVIALKDIAPQSDELMINVAASQGRVVAAVSDEFAHSPGATAGSEWLPAQALPSRVLRLAGLPEKADSRTLLVANPADREAVVDVRVAGTSGLFAPAGLDQVSVPPGAVVATDLTKSFGTAVGAVRLRSQVPVVAGVRSVSGSDSSYAASVTPLSGPAAAPVVAGARTTVLVTAGELRARASVRAYDADGTEVASKDLVLEPTATAAWSPGDKATYLVLTPGRGSVSGAVSISGRGLSQAPLAGLSVRLRRPDVHPVPY